MRKIIARCGIGFYQAEHEEEFEFDDSWSDIDIENALYEWAEQFLEVSWEEEEEED